MWRSTTLLLLLFLLVSTGVAAVVAIPLSARLLQRGLQGPLIPQQISSSSISCGNSCAFTPGTAGQTIGTVSVVMNPLTPTFASSGGTFSFVTSGGSCSGGDTTDFTIGSSSGVVTNTSSGTGAGSYTACVKETEAGITNSPQYLTVLITGTGAVAKINGEWWWPFSPPTIGTMMSQAPEVNYTAVAVTGPSGQPEGGVVSDVNWSSGSGYASQAAFKTDFTAWIASGRTMTLMIGGGAPCGSSQAINSPTAVSQFMASMATLTTTYPGLSGVEFDLEDQAGCAERAEPTNMANLIQQLKATYGSGFIIALDPAPFNLRPCYTVPWTYAACGETGEYRQIILNAGIANIDIVAPQDYGLAGDSLAAQRSYMDGDMADWIGNGTGLYIPANKIIIGSCVAEACSGAESLSTALQTYQYYKGVYPTLRGNMNWQDWTDSGHSWQVAAGIANLP